MSRRQINVEDWGLETGGGGLTRLETEDWSLDKTGEWRLES